MKARFWSVCISVCFAGLLLAGCSSSSGSSEDSGGNSPPVGGNGEATVSGKITYDRVPHDEILGGLDYGSTVTAPVRGAVVEAIDAGNGSAVLASTATDEQGDYVLAVPAEMQMFIRVKAQLLRTGAPSWDFTVVDNTNGDALYVLDGAAFDSGMASTVRNLHAPSGWGGASYTSVRAAAPFSILDAVYESFNLVLSADPVAEFPPLELNWSPNNRPESPFEPEDGAIVTSSFRFPGDLEGGEIFILGAADNDTDEYDRHVVAHEWGHYFENLFSRSDSIGGPHFMGDYLDPRVAFGEAFGNAFSGMSLGDPEYRDALGTAQSTGFFFNMDMNDVSDPKGWYSESSIQAILYDLFDDADDGMDAVTLGFGPIYDVLTDEQRNTEALTTIFSFIPPLKLQNADDAGNIDALVAEQDIVAVNMDEYGSTEMNNADNGQDVLPVYKEITIGGMPVEVCSLGGEENPPQDYGSMNKLSNARFLKFTVSVPGSYTFTAVGQTDTDPDLWLHDKGLIRRSESDTPGLETFAQDLEAGGYVLEIFEFSNIEPGGMPRGKSCFDISIN